MAYLAEVGGRPLRLEVVQDRDGTLLVEVTELAGAGTAAAGAAGTGTGGRPEPAAAPAPSAWVQRTYRLDAHGAGRGWLAVRLEAGRSVDAFVERRSSGPVVWLDGVVYHLDLADERTVRRARAGRAAGGGPQTLTAPMPGKIVRHLAAVGDRVEAGQGVIVVEAMKMENELQAPAAGVVKALPAAEGTAVEAGAPLAVIE